MATTQKQTSIAVGVNNAITPTALNAMANNALVLGTAISNIQGGAFDGYVRCLVVLNYKFQVLPAANTGFSLWLLRPQLPGTNGTFEDGGTAYTPQRMPDCVFPVDSVAGTSARQIAREIRLPVGFVAALLKNDGTGQALTANNIDNYLTITPITDQSV